MIEYLSNNLFKRYKCILNWIRPNVLENYELDENIWKLCIYILYNLKSISPPPWPLTIENIALYFWKHLKFKHISHNISNKIITHKTYCSWTNILNSYHKENLSWNNFTLSNQLLKYHYVLKYVIFWPPE